MSEELDKNQKIKENFQYVPEENVELIVDKPSEPLKKVKKVTKQQPTTTIEPLTTTTTLAKVELRRVEKVSKSNKELYESYLKELKNFCLSINGEIIYDSSIDKFKDVPVKFENDYFVLYGRKYSYNGLKIQKINSNK